MSTAAARVQQRQIIRARRQALSQSEQQQASQALLSRLITHSKVKQAEDIALYISNDGELDTRAFIHWCWHNNKRVYLPIIHPFTKGHLLFLRYQQSTIMVTNQYGIAEPKLDVRDIIAPAQLDIIFTPLVAFDDSGARLGMGGGFYDRTLASWYLRYQHDSTAQPYPIGLAHNCQQLDKIATEQWDVPLPELITPTKTLLFT